MPATAPQSQATTIALPELALVALIGASAAGKSTFAARHFESAEVFGDEGGQTDPEHLWTAAGQRLSRGQLSVIDAPLVRPVQRRRVLELAREHDVWPVAIVLDLPRSVLEDRLKQRPDQNTNQNADEIRAELIEQVAELRRTLRGLHKEGFRDVWILRTPEEVEQVRLERVPLPTNKKHLHGPFDFIGDVHGCLDELRELLGKLGYTEQNGNYQHPAGRTAVFVGDLVDRGPDSAGVLRLVMAMEKAGAALVVPGNHDEKLKRALEGKAVKALHGLDKTLEQLDAAGEEFKTEVREFVEGLVSHLMLDEGRVVVAHAGLPAHYQGRSSGRVRSFALYGDVDGSKDEVGMPVRRDWAAEYRGEPLVIYGHTPVVTPRWINRTLDLDTGCAFGGALTALRYPELEVVSVAAHAPYAVPGRPFVDLQECDLPTELAQEPP